MAPSWPLAAFSLLRGSSSRLAEAAGPMTGCRPSRPPVPTLYGPGTAAKVAVLEARAARGESLFSNHDSGWEANAWMGNAAYLEREAVKEATNDERFPPRR